jgi:hypothetical protein
VNEQRCAARRGHNERINCKSPPVQGHGDSSSEPTYGAS